MKIVFQTTINAETFAPHVEEIRRRVPDTRVADTICYATKENQDALRVLCDDPAIDAIVVIGGKNSKNTKELARIAQARKPTFLIGTAAELDLARLRRDEEGRRLGRRLDARLRRRGGRREARSALTEDEISSKRTLGATRSGVGNGVLHNASDVAALLLAIGARALGRKAPTRRFSYGFRRLEVVAALVNAAVLVGLAVLVGREAVDRLRHPSAVDGHTMLAVALVAFVANVAAVLLLGGTRSTT